MSIGIKFFKKENSCGSSGFVKILAITYELGQNFRFLPHSWMDLCKYGSVPEQAWYAYHS